MSSSPDKSHFEMKPSVRIRDLFNFVISLLVRRLHSRKTSTRDDKGKFQTMDVKTKKHSSKNALP